MKNLNSCGFIIFSSNKYDEFLLLKHASRYDLPKGHIETGETEIECAIRELEEETGIKSGEISIARDFKFEDSYITQYKRFNNESVQKTVTIFLAYLLTPKEISLTEHIDFEWIKWNPLLIYEEKTINSLIQTLAEYFQTIEI